MGREGLFCWEGRKNLSELKIVAVKIHSNMKWNTYKDLLSIVSKERQARISRMKFDADRLRLLIGEMIARTYISKKIGVPYQLIEFKQGLYGKPYVTIDKPLSFNWSHAGDWILFAMDSKTVGVDVEYIHHVKELDLAKRFFAPQEVAQLETMSPEASRRHFFKLWSLKESYIKWKGTGMSTSLDSFYFIDQKEQGWKFYNYYGDICFFRLLLLDDNHYAVVCTSRFYKKVLVEKLDAEQFLRSYI